MNAVLASKPGVSGLIASQPASARQGLGDRPTSNQELVKCTVMLL